MKRFDRFANIAIILFAMALYNLFLRFVFFDGSIKNFLGNLAFAILPASIIWWLKKNQARETFYLVCSVASLLIIISVFILRFIINITMDTGMSYLVYAMYPIFGVMLPILLGGMKVENKKILKTTQEKIFVIFLGLYIINVNFLVTACF